MRDALLAGNVSQSMVPRPLRRCRLTRERLEYGDPLVLSDAM
jgi:hypothetical protein